MDATLLNLESVRCVLALTAFGVTGCLAWFQEDAAAPRITVDASPDSPPDVTVLADASLADAGALDARAVVDAPPAATTDPADRDEAAVCARWNTDTADLPGLAAWAPGASTCDPGALPPATRAAAVRLTNTYRWLAGLAPVRDEATQTAAAQACAVLVERNGQLDHTPPMTWTCWSQLGYQGTSSSNITGLRGFRMTVPAAINGWIDDSRDLSNTLGHRRWMLFPPLSAVGYGQSAGYACLHILGATSNPRARSYVAWPNAGATPMGAMTRIWSLSSATLGVGAGTRVEVTRDGAPLSVTAQMRAGNYGDPTVSWAMPEITAGSRYAVRLTGLAGADVRYEVRPAACP